MPSRSTPLYDARDTAAAELEPGEKRRTNARYQPGVAL
jgi:hypothetical protein